MSRAAMIRARIEAGEGPDPRSVEAVVSGSEAARLGASGAAAARDALAAEVLGLGPLDACVEDPHVTDVLVNGDGSVWLDRGRGLERAPLWLEDDSAARRLAVRLAGLAGRRLDESQPWVDGLLPQGIRLHAVLPPLVKGGAHVSLRIPRVSSARLDDLARSGMFDATTARLLAGLVRERRSFLVTGGTGSGKTTLLGAMLAEVPASERIVLVEDVRELAICHPHVVSLQGREANIEGRGQVSLVDLVRQALRMRPDRLVVGEVRGPEVRELLAALNTGHEGGCGTVHANSPADLPARFEALGALAGLDREAVHAQLASAVSAVVHVERGTSGRAVTSLSVLERSSAGPRCRLGLDATTGDHGPGWSALCGLVGLGS